MENKNQKNKEDEERRTSRRQMKRMRGGGDIQKDAMGKKRGKNMGKIFLKLGMV